MWGETVLMKEYKLSIWRRCCNAVIFNWDQTFYKTHELHVIKIVWDTLELKEENSTDDSHVLQYRLIFVGSWGKNKIFKGSRIKFSVQCLKTLWEPLKISIRGQIEFRESPIFLVTIWLMKEQCDARSCLGNPVNGLGGQECRRTSWYLGGLPLVEPDHPGNKGETTVDATSPYITNTGRPPLSASKILSQCARKHFDKFSSSPQTVSFSGDRSTAAAAAAVHIGAKTKNISTRTMQKSEPAVRRRAVRSSANPLNRRSWPLAPGAVRQQLKVSFDTCSWRWDWPWNKVEWLWIPCWIFFFAFMFGYDLFSK